MLAKEITSLQHPIVKHLVKLKNERAYRLEEKSVLIMGNKLVAEICANLPLKILLVEQGVSCQLTADQIFTVTAEILKKITGLNKPEPIAAVISTPPPGNLGAKQLLIALDGISDPGNLGTLLRTALALNWEAAFITHASADPFNDKALRAAKGATFRLPLMQGSWQELDALIDKHKMNVYIADIEGEPLHSVVIQKPALLILGNESHGVNPAAKEKYKRVCIPMNPNMQSLNVASAGAILMYHMRSK